MMMYLSVKLSESIFCTIFEWIKLYFNSLGDNCDRYNSENDGKHQLNRNMHCVTIDCILISIMNVICTMYFVYSLINHFLCHEITLSHYFMQIMSYSIILYHYYNQLQRMEFYSLIKYCIVFIIVVSGLW